jgi:mitogen-activated protein kinase 1/3
LAFTAGGAARPGKVVGSVLRYNNCGAAAAAAEAIEQRRMARNSAVPTQYAVSASSYPKRHPSYKSEKEEGGIEGPTALQPKPDQYIARKVAAQVGSDSQWY